MPSTLVRFFLWNRFSLYSPGCPETPYVAQAADKVTGLLLPLPLPLEYCILILLPPRSECWDCGLGLTCPAPDRTLARGSHGRARRRAAARGPATHLGVQSALQLQHVGELLRVDVVVREIDQQPVHVEPGGEGEASVPGALGPPRLPRRPPARPRGISPPRTPKPPGPVSAASPRRAPAPAPRPGRPIAHRRAGRSSRTPSHFMAPCWGLRSTAS